MQMLWLDEVDLAIAAAGSYRLHLSSPDGNFPAAESSHNLQAGNQTVSVNFAVPNPRLWSPETPHLYDVQVELLPGDANDGVHERLLREQ